MKLKLGNNIFECPEGKWTGTCEAIDIPKKRINRPCESQVRLRFRVMTNDGEKLVAKTFCADLSYGSELYSFIESWLDGNFDKYLDDDGNIDLDLLIGAGADFLIAHGPRFDSHTFPFVNVAGIFPAGRLTRP